MSSSQSEDIYGHLTFTQNLHSSKKSNLYSKVTSNSRDDDFSEKAIAQANNTCIGGSQLASLLLGFLCGFIMDLSLDIDIITLTSISLGSSFAFWGSKLDDPLDINPKLFWKTAGSFCFPNLPRLSLLFLSSLIFFLTLSLNLLFCISSTYRYRTGGSVLPIIHRWSSMGYLCQIIVNKYNNRTSVQNGIDF